MAEHKIAYIYDPLLLKQCDRLPMVQGRASMVHDLITSYNLLSKLTLVRGIPATDDELKYFHSSDYIQFLKDCNDKNIDEITNEEFDQLLSFGLIDDCYLLPKCYDLVKTIAGSSLTAVKLIVENKFHRVINFFGGWHHAQRDKAEGFCYVNDIVVSIQYLTRQFKRIFYVDLDAHHGDGVQNAFEYSRNILTMSLHRFSPGFYPNSGSVDDIGVSKGKYFSINLPLKDYISSGNYEYVFKTSFNEIFDSFLPEVIIVQCGADVISGDQIGGCNVSVAGMLNCIKDILKKDIPTVFLGGGGYNLANTARYWTSIAALILNNSISNDIPDSSAFFTKYTPTYELSVPEKLIPDKNSIDYLNDVLNKIKKYSFIIKNK